MSNLLSSKINSEGGSEWLSISDMMTGLMVIFLFIALSYMIPIQKKNKKMFEVAETLKLLHENLYQDLLQEFKEDLPRWSARIDSTSLSVTFTEPDVLFEAGKSNLRPRFRAILRSFFPRYVNILTNEKYKNDIEEVRIEGHTSSDWKELSPNEAYFENMGLSQSRTRSVLKYVMSLIDDSNKYWLKSHFTANGLSSSKLIWRDEERQIEDKGQSRRVEFRVRTDAEKKISEIISIGD